MAYGRNPNRAYKSESGEVVPEYPEIFLHVGKHAIWWTGNITGVPYGDDLGMWIAPIVRFDGSAPEYIDLEAVESIDAKTDWSGTMWADYRNGPSKYDLDNLARTCRDMVLLGSRFVGE